MASFNNNNKHWPSMFRSKHAAQPWQPQIDVTGSPPSLVSGGSTMTATTGGSINKHSFPGAEERTPDPKPRWNPRPEQIRILEAIFNSGLINPPRDEIPRIRMRLQEYGPVGDANVFYWFQNRKARTKNKLRAAGGLGRAALVAAMPPAQPQIQMPQQVQPSLVAPPVQAQQAPTSSSSSSSDRSSGSSRPAAKPQAPQAMTATEAMDLLGPLAAACPQVYYPGQPVAAPAPKVQTEPQHVAAADETIFLPVPQGYCLSAAELAAILGAQYMHVPAVHQQQAASPHVPFLGLCSNDAVAAPSINGHRSCTIWGGSGLRQYGPSGAANHHHLCKNAAASASNAVAKVVDATKPGLLQYDFGVSSPAMDAVPAVSVTLPLSASPDAAVTVAASTTASASAELTGLAATTAANGVITNYDQFQGLTDGVVVTGAPPATAGVAPAAAGAPPLAGRAEEEVAVLCIGDSATGRSVVREVQAGRHLDVRSQFGDAAVLFRYVGDSERPVHIPVDAASGCTVEPLQHGVVYWVLV